jgi:hypothetical protein
VPLSFKEKQTLNRSRKKSPFPFETLPSPAILPKSSGQQARSPQERRLEKDGLLTVRLPVNRGLELSAETFRSLE